MIKQWFTHIMVVVLTASETAKTIRNETSTEQKTLTAIIASFDHLVHPPVHHPPALTLK
jgi:hypothetical protein